MQPYKIKLGIKTIQNLFGQHNKLADRSSASWTQPNWHQKSRVQSRSENSDQIPTTLEKQSNLLNFLHEENELWLRLSEDVAELILFARLPSALRDLDTNSVAFHSFWITSPPPWKEIVLRHLEQMKVIWSEVIWGLVCKPAAAHCWQRQAGIHGFAKWTLVNIVFFSPPFLQPSK